MALPTIAYYRHCTHPRILLRHGNFSFSQVAGSSIWPATNLVQVLGPRNFNLARGSTLSLAHVGDWLCSIVQSIPLRRLFFFVVFPLQYPLIRSSSFFSSHRPPLTPGCFCDCSLRRTPSRAGFTIGCGLTIVPCLSLFFSVFLCPQDAQPSLNSPRPQGLRSAASGFVTPLRRSIVSKPVSAAFQVRLRLRCIMSPPLNSGRL